MTKERCSQARGDFRASKTGPWRSHAPACRRRRAPQRAQRSGPRAQEAKWEAPEEEAPLGLPLEAPVRTRPRVPVVSPPGVRHPPTARRQVSPLKHADTVMPLTVGGSQVAGCPQDLGTLAHSGLAFA